MSVRGACLIAMVLFGMSWCWDANVGYGAPTDFLPAVCDALAADDNWQSYGPGDYANPVELIAVGTATKSGEKYSLQIERCLYGDPDLKSLDHVSLQKLRSLGPDLHAVYALSHPREDYWAIRHVYPLDEIEWQAAVGRARSDGIVLGASAIFIGKSTEKVKKSGPFEDSPNKVTVIRSLYGSLQAGDEVKFGRNYLAPVATFDEEYIFFVTPGDHDRFGRKGSRPWKGSRPADSLAAVWTLNREREVTTALGRRDQYPVNDPPRKRLPITDLGKIGHDGEPAEELESRLRGREIIFQGSAVQAIEMLGSVGNGARILAARTLFLNPNDARAALARYLSQQVTAAPVAGYGQNRRIEAAIQVLADLSELEKSQTEIGRLIEQIILQIDKERLPTADSNVQTTRKKRYWSSVWETEISANDDRPHALAWLIKRLPRNEAVSRYASRLCELKPFAPPQWKQSIQEAIDLCSLEDSLALNAAWAKMREQVPVTLTRKAPERTATTGPSNDEELNIYTIAPLNNDRRLLTWGFGSQRILVWDIVQRTAVEQITLPKNERPIGMFGPGNAWLFCEPTSPSLAQDAQRPLKYHAARLLDLEQRQFRQTLWLPEYGPIGWVTNDEYVWRFGNEWRRVRAADGKTLKQQQIDEPKQEGYDPFSSLLFPNEDGSQIWEWGSYYGSRGRSFPILRVWDAKELTLLRDVKARIDDGRFGIVPGGKYFHVGTQIFERESGKPIYETQYEGSHEGYVTFARDGCIFAAAADIGIHLTDPPEEWKKKKPHERRESIHIHETASGRLLAVVPVFSGYSASALRFTRDGTRLIVAESPYLIRVWDLRHVLP